MTTTRTAREVLDKAVRVIEEADARAEATDGPVGHVRDELTDGEWRYLYLLIKEARDASGLTDDEARFKVHLDVYVDQIGVASRALEAYRSAISEQRQQTVYGGPIWRALTDERDGLLDLMRVVEEVEENPAAFEIAS